MYRDFVQLPCVSYKRRLVHRNCLPGRKGGKSGESRLGGWGLLTHQPKRVWLCSNFWRQKSLPSFHLQFRALFTDTTRSYTVPADGYLFRIVNPQTRSKLDWKMMGNHHVNRLFGLRVSGMNSTRKFPKFEGVFCRSKTDAGKQLACSHILLFGQVFLSSYISVEFDRFMKLLYCIFLNLSQCLSANSNGGRTASPATRIEAAFFRRNRLVWSTKRYRWSWGLARIILLRSETLA